MFQRAIQHERLKRDAIPREPALEIRCDVPRCAGDVQPSQLARAGAPNHALHQLAHDAGPAKPAVEHAQIGERGLHLRGREPVGCAEKFRCAGTFQKDNPQLSALSRQQELVVIPDCCSKIALRRALI